jgi:hypothetical protein
MQQIISFPDLTISQLEDLYNSGGLKYVRDMRLTNQQFIDIGERFLSALLKDNILHTESE